MQMLRLLLHLLNNRIPVNPPLVLVGRNLKTISIIRTTIHGVTMLQLVSCLYRKVISHKISHHSSSLLILLHNSQLLRQAHLTKAAQIKQIHLIAFSVLRHSQNQSNSNRNSLRNQQHLILIVSSQMMMLRQTSQLQVSNRKLIFLLRWINKKIGLISITKTQQLQEQLKQVQLTQKA